MYQTLIIIIIFSIAHIVQARHQLLLGAIGTFDEEDKANQLVTLLAWILPTAVIFSGIIDAILAYCYMAFFHPWIGILGGLHVVQCPVFLVIKKSYLHRGYVCIRLKAFTF